MVNFKKYRILKILNILIAGIFIIDTAGYGYTLPNKSSLRVPSMTTTTEGRKRLGESATLMLNQKGAKESFVPQVDNNLPRYDIGDRTRGSPQAVFKLMSDGVGRKRSYIASLLNCSEETIQPDLHFLISAGVLLKYDDWRGSVYQIDVRLVNDAPVLMKKIQDLLDKEFRVLKKGWLNKEDVRKNITELRKDHGIYTEKENSERLRARNIKSNIGEHKKAIDTFIYGTTYRIGIGRRMQEAYGRLFIESHWLDIVKINEIAVKQKNSDYLFEYEFPGLVKYKRFDINFIDRNWKKLVALCETADKEQVSLRYLFSDLCDLKDIVTDDNLKSIGKGIIAIRKNGGPFGIMGVLIKTFGTKWVKAHWKDFVKMGIAAGENLEQLFRHIGGPFDVKWVKAHWKDFVAMYIASGKNSGYLAEYGFPDMKEALEDAGKYPGISYIETHWKDFVKLIMNARENSGSLFRRELAGLTKKFGVAFLDVLFERKCYDYKTIVFLYRITGKLTIPKFIFKNILTNLLISKIDINNETLLLNYLESNSIILNKEPKYLISKYNEVEKYFEIKNNKLEESRRIDQKKFFNSNESNIILLSEIMGEDVFNFLKKFLNKDPYPLERFFEALDITNLNEDTFNVLKELYNHNLKKDFDSFQKILEITGLYRQNGKIIVFLDTLKESMESDLSWKSASDNLSIRALKDTAEGLGIVTGDIKPGVLSRFIVSYIPRLKIAMDFIRNNHSDKLGLFKSLLKATFEDNYKDFMTNENQPDEIGRELAMHNKSVREDIKNCGIDPEKWLGYNKEEIFSYSDRNSQIDPEDELIRSAELIRSLYKKIDEKYQIMLKNTLRKIGLEVAEDKDKMPLKPINKNNGNIQDVLKLFAASGNMERLDKSIDFIKKKFDADIPIQENILHLSQSMSALRQQILNPSALKELYKKKMNFNVRMWKRDPCHDLFLGDLTGCCMAANSNQHFEAMVDHLIDHGIQVVEVIDQGTGRTIALAWLFLAKDKNNRPYLVIDNIEVNDSYSSVTPLKETIKNNLIEYCKEYAEYINCSSLLAGLFGYSKVNINEFPKHTFNLDKIGGYFEDEGYYLEALGNKEMRVIEKYGVESIKMKYTKQNRTGV